MDFIVGQSNIFLAFVRGYSVELTAAFVILSASVWRIYLLDRSQKWPVSDGRPSRILSEQRGNKHLLKILYSYRVQDEPIQLVGKFEKYFPSAHEAERWASALNQQTLIVHFNPRKPSQSVLWERELIAIVFRER
jgi:hypothetical protein